MTTTLKRTRAEFVSLDSLLSIEQWAAMPDVKPRYELVDGKLIQKMPTTTAHAWTITQLLLALSLWGRESGWNFLVEGVGFRADEFNGFVADILGFAPDKKFNPDATYCTDPTLVVEVLSKSTAKKDRTTKKKGYARGGVTLYLLADPKARTLEIYRLQDGVYGVAQVLKNDDVWTPEELPELKLEVAKLWM